MFGIILFGWRKASKCKKLVRLLHFRLKLLKRKRYSLVRQLRDDIAQLLKIGQTESAFSRVEQLFRDQSFLDAYDLLEQYCELIILHFPYIRRNKDRPEDINEAISTLVFADAWFGDLPELRVIKGLFSERYGLKFIKDVTELKSGHRVNLEIREKLCIKSVSDDVKLKLISEIAKDYGLQLLYLRCNNRPKHLLQLCGHADGQLDRFVFEGEACTSYNSVSGAMMLASYAKHRSDVMSKFVADPEDVAPICRRAVQVDQNQPRDKHVYHPSEISNQFHKRTLYVEEVEELEFDTLQDQYGEDKRLFVFKASLCPLIKENRVDGGSRLLALPRHGYVEGDRNKPKSQDRIALSGNSCKKMKQQFMAIQYGNGTQKSTKLGEAEASEFPERYSSSSYGSYSNGSSPCSRKTISLKRPNGTAPDIDKQTVPSQLQHSKGRTNSSCSHVHPKLPDYDELAAKFRL